MTHEQWRHGIAQRVAGTFNLEKTFGTDLDFFVMLASSAGVIGTYGHGNYAAGCTFQDAVARRHTAAKFPVHCIDIGMVSGEGIAAENEEIIDFISRNGIRSQTVDEFLALLNRTIQPPSTDSAAEAQIVCGITRPHPDSGTGEAIRLRADVKFSHIYSRKMQEETLRVSRDAHDFQPALRSADTPATACEVTHAALKRKVSELLAVPEDGLQAMRSVASYGVDSLVSVELRNWVSAYLGSFLEMFELMGSMPMLQSAELIARRSRLVPAGVFEHKEASWCTKAGA